MTTDNDDTTTTTTETQQQQQPRHRFLYLRDENRHPFGCISMLFDKANKELKYQYSVCNSKDDFDRKTAREISFGRMQTKPITLTDVDPNYGAHLTSRQVMLSIVDLASQETRMSKPKTHPKTLEAVQRWLDFSNKKLANKMV